MGIDRYNSAEAYEVFARWRHLCDQDQLTPLVCISAFSAGGRTHLRANIQTGVHRDQLADALVGLAAGLKTETASNESGTSPDSTAGED